jgi:hypothetical protein
MQKKSTINEMQEFFVTDAAQPTPEVKRIQTPANIKLINTVSFL